MKAPEYKLTLNLTLYVEPPSPPEICTLCKDIINGAVYAVQVEQPLVNELLFDEICFDQLLAVGFKLYQSINSPQEKKN